MNRARWFALVVGLQAALLVGWSVYNEWNRATAATILLETVPVDPRDLLRGDFMILSYKISRVPAPPGPTGAVYAGRDIWVSLKQNGRFHEVVSAAWARPENPEAGITLVHARTQRNDGSFIRVEYDIEKYFVPEGKGRPVFKEMVVEATVSPLQRLGIKRLLLDGKSYP